MHTFIHIFYSYTVHKLLRGLDQRHDDSFYLSQCSQETLKKLVLPLGDFTKDIVPKVADSAGLNALTDFDSKVMLNSMFTYFRYIALCLIIFSINKIIAIPIAPN